jgi:KipI family sensor histidine kinase inhibitor
MRPTIAPLGDAALLVEFGETIDDATIDRVHVLTGRLRAAGCGSDIVPAYASVAIHLNAEASLLAQASDDIARLLASEQPTAGRHAARKIIVPVHYGGDDGPDLDSVAEALGMSAADVVVRHSAATYRVAFLGFSPGFPYLRGLDPQLAVPRRSTPRQVVPAGSVAIGGAQTGVYPRATPGGWHLIGRTGERLFDPYRAEPCLLLAGDQLCFKRVDEIRGEPVDAPPVLSGRPALHVEHPGLLATLQDLGRTGQQHFGVSPGGALDRFAHRAANLLVGNSEHAPTLEITMIGPRLVAASDLLVALCGAQFDATVNGARLPLWQAVAVRRGSQITIGTPAAGARACLAVAGGFAAIEALGGRGTALRDGFGGFHGRALQKGDILLLSDEPAFRGEHLAPLDDDRRSGKMNRVPDALLERAGGALRVLQGPHWSRLDAASQTLFGSRTFDVTPSSDRMGLRLAGSALRFVEPLECISAGVATGTIQLPPDGQPIVLLADRQTTGGYPRLGEIISADLDRLAQLRPGESVSFSVVSLAEAHRAAAEEAERWQRVREWLR